MWGPNLNLLTHMFPPSVFYARQITNIGICWDTFAITERNETSTSGLIAQCLFTRTWIVNPIRTQRN
jgi:hypothetical protein